jgi:hypothetical protein
MDPSYKHCSMLGPEPRKTLIKPELFNVLEESHSARGTNDLPTALHPRESYANLLRALFNNTTQQNNRRSDASTDDTPTH